MPFIVFSHILGGKNNLARHELESVFDLLLEQKLLTTVFYDGQITCAADFASMMADERTWFYLLCANRHRPMGQNSALRVRGFSPLGFCWLNNHTGTAAMFHFSLFRQAFGQAKSIASFMTRLILLAAPHKAVPYSVCAGTAQDVQAYQQEIKHTVGANSPSSAYCLDALYGVTPTPFRHALSLAIQTGFTTVGVMPYAARLATKKRVVPATLTCLTREGLAKV